MGLIKLAAAAAAAFFGYKLIVKPYLARRSFKVVGRTPAQVKALQAAVLSVAARLKGARIAADVVGGEHGGALAVLVKPLEHNPRFVAEVLPGSIGGIEVVVLGG